MSKAEFYEAAVKRGFFTPDEAVQSAQSILSAEEAGKFLRMNYRMMEMRQNLDEMRLAQLHFFVALGSICAYLFPTI